MLLISLQEVGSRSDLPMRGLVRKNNLLQLAPGEAAGKVDVFPLHPRLVESWVGFQLLPETPGVTVAVCDAEGNPYAYESGWVESDGLAFMSPSDLRDRIEHWQGAGIQLTFRLVRQPDGSSPLLGQYQVGYRITGDILSDIFQFNLPSLLETPVDAFISYVAAETDGSLTTPDGYECDRMSEIRIVKLPEGGTVSCSVATESSLRPAAPVPGGRLLFKYALRGRYHSASEILQVDRLPSFSISFEEVEYTRYDWEDRLQSNDIKQIVSQGVGSRRASGIIRLHGHTDQEAMHFSQQLEALFRKGFLEVPAYGLILPISVISSTQLEMGTKDRLYDAQMSSATFKVRIWHHSMPVASKEEDLITEIAPITPARMSYENTAF